MGMKAYILASVWM